MAALIAGLAAAPQGARAANECGGIPAGPNSTVNCAGIFNNGIEYEPGAGNEVFTLNVGDGTIGGAAAVTAPPAGILGFGQVGVGIADFNVNALTGATPVGGVPATSILNINEFSQVTGTSIGALVWTDGTDNDATVNNYGTILATGQGTASLGIGIAVVAGNPFGGPAGSGNATGNNYGTVNALNNALSVWSQEGTATALNEGTLNSQNGSGIAIIDPLLGIAPTGGAAIATNAGLINAAEFGILVSSVGDANATNTVDGVINSADHGMDVTTIAGALTASNAGAITSTGGDGMNLTNLGSGGITATNSGAIVAGDNGIFALGGTLGGGGSADVTVTSSAGGTVDFSGFVGMGAVNLDGNANVTVGDKITYSGGPGFSVGAFAVAGGGGNATVNVNAAIDPPLIGAATFTFGAGTATTNVNALTQATGLGAFAGNLGSGNVAVNVVSPNGAIQSDGIGILTLNIGDGDSTVSLDGAVGGLSGAATALDGVLMLGFGNDGNMSLTSTANGTINAGDDAVSIYKVWGGGTIDVDLNANATGAEDGVDIYRMLSGPNVAGANDITVNIGQTSPMTLTAGTGNGIEIDTPFANNDVNINVGTGSSVIADDGSAIDIEGFSVLGDNAVNIENDGLLRGEGSIFDPTIFVETDGAVNIHNDVNGTIQSDGGSAFASIIQSYSGDTNTVVNDGTMTGSVQLFSFNGNSVTNTSSNTWNTAGLNLFLSGGANVLDNTANGTINTGPLTTFLFVGPTDNTVNNSGVINVNQGGGGLFSLTSFIGSDFGFPPSQNLEFNNTGGQLNMSNGVSDFGLATPNTVPGFLGGPLGPYENGIGDVTFIGGNFNGTGDSRLGIDAFLDASDNSSADLMVVGFPGSGVGNTTGSTGIIVNDLNAGPGSYNPNGILVVDVEGTSPDDSFYLVGGPIDKGLFNYDLYRVEVGSVDWILASTPNARAFELPKLITGGQEVWHQSSGVWLDRTADLRTMYGTAAIYGPAAAPTPSYVGLPPDKAPVADKGAPADKGLAMAPAQPRYSAWGRAFGADYDRDVTDTTTLFGVTTKLVGDYSQDVFGAQAGIDVVISKTANTAFVVGALGGFATSDMDFDSTGDKATLDGPMAGIYATYLKGAWFVDVLGLGQWLDTELKTTFDGEKATTDIESYGVVLDTGFRFAKPGGGMFIEPMGTLAWVSTKMDDFDLLGASVDPDDGDSLLGRLALRVGTQFVSGNHRFEPFILGSLWHEFEGDNSVQLASGGFILPVADDTEGTYGEVGGGINMFSLNGGFSAFAKGDVRISDDIDGVSGKAGLRFTW